jgi:ABC-type nitrate/sulfonate/bicarbonate transport system substrate-binding protein
MLTGLPAGGSTWHMAEPAAPLSLTFMAGYKPQANLPFVGVYVAQEKGYFAAENLDVIIEHSPGQGQHLQMVATGKVQVTTQDAAVLLKRRADPGLPLVSIALIGQQGQQAFAALLLRVCAHRLIGRVTWLGTRVPLRRICSRC